MLTQKNRFLSPYKFAQTSLPVIPVIFTPWIFSATNARIRKFEIYLNLLCELRLAIKWTVQFPS